MAMPATDVRSGAVLPPPPAFDSLPRRQQRALGTEVRVTGVGADRALAELERLEELLTRFHPSPVTRLNALGRLRPAPPELVAALRHALAVAADTGGLITPLVLPALRWAGYRDPWPASARPSAGPPPPVADWHEVAVDDDAVALPAGAEIDLGGTGKSWIVERCFAALEGEALLDAGGDLVTRSPGEVAIDVAHPYDGEPLQLVLPPGRWGVATSGVLARAWPGGHHLIDPRNARPAQTRFVQATALHPDLRRAEVLTKLALLTPDAGALADATLLVAFDRDGVVWHHRDGGDWGRP